MGFILRPIHSMRESRLIQQRARIKRPVFFFTKVLAAILMEIVNPIPTSHLTLCSRTTNLVRRRRASSTSKIHLATATDTRRLDTLVAQQATARLLIFGVPPAPPRPLVRQAGSKNGRTPLCRAAGVLRRKSSSAPGPTESRPAALCP